MSQYYLTFVVVSSHYFLRCVIDPVSLYNEVKKFGE